MALPKLFSYLCCIVLERISILIIFYILFLSNTIFHHTFRTSYESQNIQSLYTPAGRLTTLCKRKHDAENYFASFFLFSIFRSNVMYMEICVKDSQDTAPRTLKFSTNIEYHLLYCVSQNQQPHVYHSFNLFYFLSLK